MFGTRSFLKKSMARIMTMIIVIMMLSVSVSWTNSHQNIEAQNQRISAFNSPSLRTTNSSMIASSDRPSNTLKKLINSICSVICTNKTQVVNGNGFLTFVSITSYHYYSNILTTVGNKESQFV